MFVKLAGSRSHKNVNLLAIYYPTLERNLITAEPVVNHLQRREVLLNTHLSMLEFKLHWILVLHKSHLSVHIHVKT